MLVWDCFCLSCDLLFVEVVVLLFGCDCVWMLMFVGLYVVGVVWLVCLMVGYMI